MNRPTVRFASSMNSLSEQHAGATVCHQLILSETCPRVLHWIWSEPFLFSRQGYVRSSTPNFLTLFDNDRHVFLQAARILLADVFRTMSTMLKHTTQIVGISAGFLDKPLLNFGGPCAETLVRFLMDATSHSSM